MLGLICNISYTSMARFVPMIAFCTPHTDRERWRVLDARHGRVLLGQKGGALVLSDPARHG